MPSCLLTLPTLPKLLMYNYTIHHIRYTLYSFSTKNIDSIFFSFFREYYRKKVDTQQQQQKYIDKNLGKSFLHRVEYYHCCVKIYRSPETCFTKCLMSFLAIFYTSAATTATTTADITTTTTTTTTTELYILYIHSFP